MDIITHDKFCVEMDEISSESLMATYKMKQSFTDGGSLPNIIIACFTTALAKLKLYDLFHYLGEIALYFYTDSCIFIGRLDQYDAETGVFLGELTS